MPALYTVTLYTCSILFFFILVMCTRRPRQKAPKFLPTPTNITVHKGEFAELGCHIKNLGPRMVSIRPFTVYILVNVNTPFML